MTFTSSAAPTGSISVTQLGSQTWSSVPGNDGQITLRLNPPITFSFTGTNNTNVGGQFALMQIVTYTRTTATAGNTTWFKQNNYDYTPTGGPNFNGNLVDGGLGTMSMLTTASRALMQQWSRPPRRFRRLG